MDFGHAMALGDIARVESELAVSRREADDLRAALSLMNAVTDHQTGDGAPPFVVGDVSFPARFHPLTCGTDSTHPPLLPRWNGTRVVLRCASCAYEQASVPDLVERLARTARTHGGTEPCAGRIPESGMLSRSLRPPPAGRSRTSAMRSPTPDIDAKADLAGCFAGGNEDELVARLALLDEANVADIPTVKRILRATSSPRVRYAAAVALSDIDPVEAADAIPDLLARDEIARDGAGLLRTLWECDGLLRPDALLCIVRNGCRATRDETLAVAHAGFVVYDARGRDYLGRELAELSHDEDDEVAETAADLVAVLGLRDDRDRRLGPS